MDLELIKNSFAKRIPGQLQVDQIQEEADAILLSGETP
jgi:hypothetical protein